MKKTTMRVWMQPIDLCGTCGEYINGGWKVMSIDNWIAGKVFE